MSISDLEVSYVTYENEQSIIEKASFLRKNGLGGLIIWEISQGYFKNRPTANSEPLMNIIYEYFLT